MRANPNWAQLPLFDRSKWETVRFGDVVDLVSETSRNPEAEGITRYIGLEHLEPGSLHIKTWGELVDGVTFTKRCRKGQVLFGKRRAYQRKVAVAEFDALVSGDIYVFQAKEELLEPKLLPFLCMSERFFQFAVETSAGSLSPRTNWSHLAEFEFALPPLDQQRRIAELLWAVDGLDQNTRSLTQACSVAKEATMIGLLKAFETEGNSLLRLDDACEVIVDGTHFTPTYVDEGVPFLRVTDIQNDPIDWSVVKRIPAEEHALLTKRCSPKIGDVLLSKNGTIGLTRIVSWPEEFSIFVSLCLLRPSKLVRSEYLEEVLRSDYVQGQFGKRAKQGTVTNLHLEEIRDCEIPVPSVEDQRDFIVKCREFDSVLRQSEIHSQVLFEVRSQVLNALMNGPEP